MRLQITRLTFSFFSFFLFFLSSPLKKTCRILNCFYKTNVAQLPLNILTSTFCCQNWWLKNTKTLPHQCTNSWGKLIVFCFKFSLILSKLHKNNVVFGMYSSIPLPLPLAFRQNEKRNQIKCMKNVNILHV